MADVVRMSKTTLVLGQITYLIETQSSPVAKLHFLVFSGIRRCSVGGEPIFQQVGSFFG